MKTATKWAIGLTATAVVVGGAIYIHKKNAAAAIPASTQTISVPLSVPSGGGQGNLGVVALPYAASLIIAAPQGASIVSIQQSPTGSLAVAAANAGAQSLQGTAAFDTNPSAVTLTISWTDSTGTSQTSTLQVVAETATTYIQLTAGQMPNLILPQTGGQIIFATPSGATAAPTGSVSGTGITTAPSAAMSGLGPGLYVLATGAGNSTLTINWTDASGNAQTSTIAVNVTPV